MPSFQDYIQEFKKLKNEPLKTKVEYIFTYYWIPIVILAFVIIILISQIIHFSTAKEVVLTGHCINTTAVSSETEQFIQEFAVASGIDTASSEISISTSHALSDNSYDTYVSNQLVTAKIAAKELDFMASDWDTLLPYAYQETFCDLRTVLTASQLQALSEYLLYIDWEVLENMTDQFPEFPDPTAPQEMTQPIPFAIQIPVDSEFIQLYYAQADKPIAIAIVNNAPHCSFAVSFLDYSCNN